MEDDPYNFDMNFDSTAEEVPAKEFSTKVVSAKVVKQSSNKMQANSYKGSAMANANKYLSKYSKKKEVVEDDSLDDLSLSSLEEDKPLKSKPLNDNKKNSPLVKDSELKHDTGQSFEEFMADSSEEEENDKTEFELPMETQSALPVRATSDVSYKQRQLENKPKTDFSALNYEMDDEISEDSLENSTVHGPTSAMKGALNIENRSSTATSNATLNSIQSSMPSIADLMKTVNGSGLESRGNIQSMSQLLANADSSMEDSSIDSSSDHEIIAGKTNTPSETMGVMHSLSDLLSSPIEIPSQKAEKAVSSSEEEYESDVHHESEDKHDAYDKYDSFEEESADDPTAPVFTKTLPPPLPPRTIQEGSSMTTASSIQATSDSKIGTTRRVEEPVSSVVVANVAAVSLAKPETHSTIEPPHLKPAINYTAIPAPTPAPAIINPMPVSRPKVKIVRDYCSNTKPEMKNVSTQFCCNDACIQVDFLPEGMKSIRKSNQEEMFIRKFNQEESSIAKEVPQNHVKSTPVVAPPIPSTSMPAKISPALESQLFASHTYEQQLKVLLQNIRQKRHEAQSIRDNYQTYRYTTFVQTKQVHQK